MTRPGTSSTRQERTSVAVLSAADSDEAYELGRGVSLTVDRESAHMTTMKAFRSTALDIFQRGAHDAPNGGVDRVGSDHTAKGGQDDGDGSTARSATVPGHHL
jgi:hypothetical protein